MKKHQVGIALGSGSARGWSHIGVLKALQAMGVEPDIVVGCSAGSLVGAAYATGNLDSFEEWVCHLGWREVMGLMDVSFTGGFIKGERLMDFFRAHDYDVSIESLEKKYAAVATDMETGREVWLQQGSLLEAIRASCAFPGLFAPGRIDNRWLLDGGLVNPVPVSLCRALGADIVIAVNLNHELVGIRPYGLENEEEKTESEAVEAMAEESDWLSRKFREWFAQSNESHNAPSMSEVLTSTINIMQDRITRSRMAGDPPDIMVVPRLGDFGMLEFHRAREAIDEGTRAVEKVADLIRRYFPASS